MKTKVILFTTMLTFILSDLLFAQNIFQKTYGGTSVDIAYSLDLTADSCYVVVGMTRSFNSVDYDIYLVKLNNNGDTLWTKSYGAIGNDRGNSVYQTLDGGYIINGTTELGSGDIILIKTDSIGNLYWSKTYGSPDVDYGWRVKQTSDGGYIMVGVADMSSSAYLIRTNSIGNIIWAKTYGGVGLEYGYAIQQTSDGGFILIGTSFGSFAGIGNRDIYVVKTDSLGNEIWSKLYGGPNDDNGFDIEQTKDGGFIMSGSTLSYGAGNLDVYIIKTDSIGDIYWSKSYGGSGWEYGYNVHPTTDGGYIITSNTTGFGAGDYEAYIIKTDSVGNSLWSKTFGGTGKDYGNDTRQTLDGGYIMVGYTENFGSLFGKVYIVKMDANGNSSCNEGNPITIESSPTTQVVNVVSNVIPIGITAAQTLLVQSGSTITTLCYTNGINELISDIPLIISPNPSNGNFVISFSELIKHGSIEFYNVIGERILTEKLFNVSKREFEFNNLNSGIYFVKVYDGEKIFSQKLIIN